MRTAIRCLARGTASTLVAGFVLAGPTGATPSALYRGPAKRLIPTATEAGYDRVTSQAVSSKRATANYEGTHVSGSGTGIATGTVAVTVFRTEAAAIAKWSTACPGCELRSFNKWRYKREFQMATDQPNRIVRLVARCQNLMAETTRTAIDSKEHLTRVSKLMIDEAIFAKAVSLGMTPCGGKSTPLPTGKFYWTETHAEDTLLRKLVIPHCTVYPSDPECRGKVGVGIRSAECRGLDEKPGTFTYSRFTCEVFLFGINVRGRVAVWPTGPTTFRWQLI